MYSNGNEAFCGFKKKFEGVYSSTKATIDGINKVTVRTHVLVTVFSIVTHLIRSHGLVSGLGKFQHELITT